MKNHVVLFSGGYDSTALLLSLIYDKKINPEEIIALNIHYGQRNIPETYVAKSLCNKYNITLDSIDITPIAEQIFNSTSLVNKNIQVDTELDKNKQPNTYVPNRNMLFLSIALSYAENIGAHNVYTAIQPHEKYYYWDATKEFIDKINDVVKLNPFGIKVHAPFATMSKKDILDYAMKIGIPVEDLKRAWSCYNPIIEKDGVMLIYKPCGKCGACQERQEVLLQEPLKINIKTLPKTI